MALALVLTLTACDRTAVSPIAARVQGGALEFVFCGGIDVDSVLIETRVSGEVWEEEVDAALDLKIEDGQIVPYSDLGGRGDSIDLQSGEQLSISIQGSGTTQTAFLVWPDESTDEWVTVDGTTTQDPCGLPRSASQYELAVASFGGDTVALGSALMPIEALIQTPLR